MSFVCCLGMVSMTTTSVAQEGGGSSRVPAALRPGDCLVVTPFYVAQKIVCHEPIVGIEGKVEPSKVDIPQAAWRGWIVTGSVAEKVTPRFPGSLSHVKDSTDVLDHQKDYEVGLRSDGVVV
jgi:hypothetical protein